MNRELLHSGKTILPKQKENEFLWVIRSAVKCWTFCLCVVENSRKMEVNVDDRNTKQVDGSILMTSRTKDLMKSLFNCLDSRGADFGGIKVQTFLMR